MASHMCDRKGVTECYEEHPYGQSNLTVFLDLKSNRSGKLIDRSCCLRRHDFRSVLELLKPPMVARETIKY